MSIASEITRLQNDKAAICTAIENKGVTVGAVTLDSYASCIDAIQQGGGRKSVDFLMMGGGGGGGGGGGTNSAGGGGGAGGVREGIYAFGGDTIAITVGAGGCGGVGGISAALGCNGGDSSIQGDGDKLIVSIGGGGGGGTCNLSGNSGGSGGGGGYTTLSDCTRFPGENCGGAGTMGSCGGITIWRTCGCRSGGGGGGATGGGMGNSSRTCIACCDYKYGISAGGMGLEGTWGCKTICYAGGGGGGTTFPGTCNWGKGHSGGGDGGNCSTNCQNGCNATTCGSGGGGGGYKSSTCCGNGGNGAGGLVIIGYNCVCKDCNGFTCATGGDSCYVCGDCKFHCFTSNGTFTVVS